MLTDTTLPTDRLWTREDCRTFCGMSRATFYRRYWKMVEEEGAPRPCTGRGVGARWLPQDWINWAARRNQPAVLDTQDNVAWSDEFAALMNGSSL